MVHTTVWADKVKVGSDHNKNDKDNDTDIEMRKIVPAQLSSGVAPLLYQ